MAKELIQIIAEKGLFVVCVKFEEILPVNSTASALKLLWVDYKHFQIKLKTLKPCCASRGGSYRVGNVKSWIFFLIGNSLITSSFCEQYTSLYKITNLLSSARYPSTAHSKSCSHLCLWIQRLQTIYFTLGYQFSLSVKLRNNNSKAHVFYFIFVFITNLQLTINRIFSTIGLW